MEPKVYLTIESLDGMMAFLTEAQKKTGYLRNVSLSAVRHNLEDAEFPMRIPVNLDGILDLAGSPIVKKMFGKKIEDGAIKFLVKAGA